MAPKPEVRRSPIAALLYGAPIGLLGGLIGLGERSSAFRYWRGCLGMRPAAPSLSTLPSASSRW
jgi:hypothetical protein